MEFYLYAVVNSFGGVLEENRFLPVGPAGSASTAEAQSSQLDWYRSTHWESCLKLAIPDFLDIGLNINANVSNFRKTRGLGWISYFYALSLILLLSKSSSSLDADDFDSNKINKSA